jgi:hypothetical protein
LHLLLVPPVVHFDPLAAFRRLLSPCGALFSLPHGLSCGNFGTDTDDFDDIFTRFSTATTALLLPQNHVANENYVVKDRRLLWSHLVRRAWLSALFDPTAAIERLEKGLSESKATCESDEFCESKRLARFWS